VEPQLNELASDPADQLTNNSGAPNVH